MITCYLGMGSNLRSPERQLRQAFAHVKTIPRTATIKMSPLYFNQAVGRRAQPAYVNCAVKITTSLPPLTLFRYCLAIEKKQQRVRKVRWGARTLDIDLLLYGDQTIHHKDLTIPHPRMFERLFVLIPLSAIYPVKGDERIKKVQHLRNKGLPSIPSLLRDELQTNPFLRCDTAEIIQQVSHHAKRLLVHPLEVFSEMREWKNRLVL